MSKDTIKVNMNIYDIPILVEQLKKLEQENKQLKEELQEANDNILWWSNRFKAVERDNRQLKEELENDIDRYEDTISYQLGYDSAKALYEKILTELEEWLEIKEEKETVGTYSMVLDKIKELKEKYK